eukprot:TRINITY_DN1094_c0_g2_i2.p1 TRINITY_DN1094_c0_g2~~TRINITY_DN1094_c0_g2_i2.p1  ORF type:complete len:413 (+),score=46.56 TRINITY_DN1094_c0_g2_i2:190-1428(+)
MRGKQNESEADKKEQKLVKTPQEGVLENESTDFSELALALACSNFALNTGTIDICGEVKNILATAEFINAGAEVQKVRLMRRQLTADSLAEFANAGAEMQKAWLMRSELTADSLDKLFNALQSSPYFESFYADMSKLSPRPLSTLLQHSSTLERLEIRAAYFAGEGLILAEGLKHNQNLSHLILYHNGLGDDVGKQIVMSVSDNPSLEVLGITNNEIGLGTLKEILKLLKNSKKLRALDVSNNNLGIEGGELIAKGIRDNKILEELNVSFNQIQAKGMIEIVKGLSANKSIKTIHISGNNGGDEMVKEFSRMLEKNERLKEVISVLNHISDEGMGYIVEMLKKNRTLQKLDLTWNGFQTGIIDLANAMKVNVTLEELCLSSIKTTEFTEDEQKLINGLKPRLKLELWQQHVC